MSDDTTHAQDDLMYPERQIVWAWMQGEMRYSSPKFDLVEHKDGQRDKHDDSMRDHQFNPVPEGFWFRQVTQYFDRARLFGLDTDKGRQALMKGLMTLFDCCGSMIRVWGLPPMPGTDSSADTVEWTGTSLRELFDQVPTRRE